MRQERVEKTKDSSLARAALKRDCVFAGVTGPRGSQSGRPPAFFNKLRMLQQIACILDFSLLLTAAPAARSGFAGTWKGMENGLPSIEMTIHDGPQGIGGVIGFYFQTREADGKWHLHDKTTVPLLSPKVEHGVLTFETIHHKKHSSPELGPNNRYRFELLGRTQGRLHVLREHGNEDAAALTLTRAR